jgi:hypothetical protein
MSWSRRVKVEDIVGKGEAMSKDKETKDSADAEGIMGRKETHSLVWKTCMVFGQLLDAAAPVAPVVVGRSTLNCHSPA